MPRFNGIKNRQLQTLYIQKDYNILQKDLS